MSSNEHTAEIKRLLNEFIPEVANGVVEIKSVVREVGQRSMVAVHSTKREVCPVGCCVGPKGFPIRAIVKELSGERVDVVKWSEPLEEFMRYAFGPAKVERIVFDEVKHQATVFVADGQLSLAAGKRGLRLQLVSQLVGWKIQLQVA